MSDWEEGQYDNLADSHNAAYALNALARAQTHLNAARWEIKEAIRRGADIDLTIIGGIHDMLNEIGPVAQTIDLGISRHEARTGETV